MDCNQSVTQEPLHWNGHLIKHTGIKAVVSFLSSIAAQKIFILYISRGTAFPLELYVRPAKTQIRILAVRSESLQESLWITNDP